MTKYSETVDPLDDSLDAVASALANPRRRAILSRLCRGPATTSELAEVASAAMPTMQQHLERLRRAGLITSTKHGRVVTHRADLAPLDALESWIAARRSFWSSQLDALADLLEDDHAT